MYEMKKVFICSPYRGDVEKNVEKARYYSRMAAVCGYCPITPHLFFPQFLKDDDPQERIKAIKLGGELMKRCDEVGVHGSRVSSGMAYELEAAKKLGLPVKLHDEQADRIFPDTLMINDRVTDELRQAVRGLKLV